MSNFPCTYSLLSKRVWQANVLVDQQGSARICDFGRSRILDCRGYTTNFACVVRYLSPELLSLDEKEDDDEMEELADIEEAPDRRQGTKKADIYAFGMVALEVGSLASLFLLSSIETHSL